MGKQQEVAPRRIRPLHGMVAVLVVLGIALTEEACSNDTDLAGPEIDTPSLSVSSDANFYDDPYEHPMYDLPDGPKDYNDLLADAASSIPGGFGGAYRNESGQTVVWLKDLTQSDVALAALMGFQPADVKSYHRTDPSNVQFVQGAYDWRDLNLWFKTAHAYWRDGVVGMDIDERTNKLYIGVTDTGIAGDVRNSLEAAGIPRDAVDVEYHAPIVPAIGAWHDNLDASAAQTVTLRSNFDPPYHSGIQHGATGLPQDAPCTMGAIVRITNSINGYLTASHCTNVMFREDNDDHFQPTINDDNIGEEYDDRGHVAGYDACQTGELCRLSDAALVRFTTASDGEDRGHIARTTGIGSYTLTSAEDDEFTIYDDEPACPFWVDELHCFPDPVGTELHYVGRTSGWRTGTLERLCMTTRYQVTGSQWYRVICVDEVRGYSEGGNSGAVVFERTNDPYDVNMWGMLTGSTTDHEFWFTSRIEGIRQELEGFNPIAIPTVN